MDLDLFVPGRLCIMGEHSDWAGSYRRFNSKIEKGYALVCGTQQGLHAKVRTHPTKLIFTSTLNDGSSKTFEVEMEVKKLFEQAEAGGYFSYACGVAYEMLTNYHVRGLAIHNYRTDLPMSKGLSSSAAVCVLVARAFNRLYDLKLSIRGEMDYAYRGEVLTPSRCGRLDQCCAYGTKAVLVTFDGDHIHTRELKVSQHLHLILVDLQAEKSTIEILAGLQAAYPFGQEPMHLRVRHFLGKVNKELVAEAVKVLESDRPQDEVGEEMGRLMVDFQRAFDEHLTDACPSQLTAPVLHRVLNHPALAPHVYGGKGVGSQGDGTAQFLCKSEEDQSRVVEILEQELHLPCLKLNFGANHCVRKAVIPCAGYCAALFPATKVCKAPLFPILDRDGLVKPAILVTVEEALEAGLDEVVIICQPHDLPELKALFQEPLPLENQASLSSTHQVTLALSLGPQAMKTNTFITRASISSRNAPKNPAFGRSRSYTALISPLLLAHTRSTQESCWIWAST